VRDRGEPAGRWPSAVDRDADRQTTKPADADDDTPIARRGHRVGAINLSQLGGGDQSRHTAEPPSRTAPRSSRPVVERGEVALDLRLGHAPSEVQADPTPLEQSVPSADIAI